MANQSPPEELQREHFQPEPTLWQSGRLCFASDPSAWLMQMSLGHNQMLNIIENVTIELFVEKNEKRGWDIVALSHIEESIGVDTACIFEQVSAHHADQIIYLAQVRSAMHAAYEVPSKENLCALRKLKDRPPPSMVREGMSQEEVAELPLPCFIAAEKLFELAIATDEGDLINKDDFERELEEREYDEETQGMAHDFMEMNEGNDDDDMDEEDPDNEDDIEDPLTYEDHEIVKDLPQYIGEGLLDGLKIVHRPSEIMAVLTYDDKGRPTYAYLNTEPSGTVVVTMIEAFEGNLVSIVAQAERNQRDAMFGEKLKEDARHHPLRELNPFDVELIAQYAGTFDNKYCRRFGWDG